MEPVDKQRNGALKFPQNIRQIVKTKNYAINNDIVEINIHFFPKSLSANYPFGGVTRNSQINDNLQYTNNNQGDMTILSSCRKGKIFVQDYVIH